MYKIDWTLLKPYSNLNTPKVTTFRLERESTVRMVAKGKVLTLYEPSEQVQVPGLYTRKTAPPRLSTSIDPSSKIERSIFGTDSQDSGDESVPSPIATRAHTSPTATRKPTSPTTRQISTSLTAAQTPTAFSLGPRKDSGNADRSASSSPGGPTDPRSKRSFLARVLDRLFQRRQRG